MLDSKRPHAGKLEGWGLSGLGVVALAYVALDYWREHAKWLSPAFAELIQPGLWGCLAISALCEAPFYKHWRAEIQAVPKFLASVIFMIAMLSMEVVMVQFVTAVLGLEWHASTDPLPDTGQWLLLALNERLPSSLVTLLRAQVIELHHYLMLFVMLGFSVLFGCVRAPGLGLASRYCVTMGIGRLFRLLTFSATILPSPRPWCASGRFWGTAAHPHPWAQKYYVPYSRNQKMIRELLQRDMSFAPTARYPPEFVPSWGVLQFLAPILRPPDPSLYKDVNKHLFLGVVRPGGGCNDLPFSGHILVATLTACAWQEAYPGWTSMFIWLMAIHSGQREIRERHHYSLDVVAAFYVGILLWKASRFLWSSDDKSEVKLGEELAQKNDQLVKAAKEGDLERVRLLLEEAERKAKGEEEAPVSIFMGLVGCLIIVLCVAIAITAFILNVGG